MIWIPSFPESIDGLPLATKASHLAVDFPYDRVSENVVLGWLTRPEVVALVLVAYLTSKKPLKTLADTIQFDGKSTSFLLVVAAHNLALTVFSAVVAFNAWLIVLRYIRENGIRSVYCDRSGEFWQSGHGAWTTIFYLSKYWEFVDTWILVLKGKKASFLQIYHHTGVVIAFWIGVLSQSAWLFVAVLLNSVIHTFMYTYFFLKTLYPSMHIPAAKYLTQAQIVQFVVGSILSFPPLLMGDECDTQSSRIALAWMETYVWGLVALFTSFAAKKYKKKEN